MIFFTIWKSQEFNPILLPGSDTKTQKNGDLWSLWSSPSWCPVGNPWALVFVSSKKFSTQERKIYFSHTWVVVWGWHCSESCHVPSWRQRQGHDVQCPRHLSCWCCLVSAVKWQLYCLLGHVPTDLSNTQCLANRAVVSCSDQKIY